MFTALKAEQSRWSLSGHPHIESVGVDVEILARVDNHIVAARQGNMVVTSFHPELTADLTVHQYFLRLVQQKAKTCVA